MQSIINSNRNNNSRKKVYKNGRVCGSKNSGQCQTNVKKWRKKSAQSEFELKLKVRICKMSKKDICLRST
jgi:hypothetical protein